MNVQLIRESFAAIKPHAIEVVAHFYEELFTRHPEAKPLFKNTDFSTQRAMLAEGLATIVENLENPKLPEVLYEMGGRHAKYGTQTEHFPLVGEALIATLEYFLEKQFTEELKSSWIEAYGVIVEHMNRGLVDALQMPGHSTQALPVVPAAEQEATEPEVAAQTEVSAQSFESTLADETFAPVLRLVKNDEKSTMNTTPENTSASTPPSIQETVQILAREVLKKAIEREITNEAFKAIVREKAQEMLRQMVEREAALVIQSAARKTA